MISAAINTDVRVSLLHANFEYILKKCVALLYSCTVLYMNPIIISLVDTHLHFHHLWVSVCSLACLLAFVILCFPTDWDKGTDFHFFLLHKGVEHFFLLTKHDHVSHHCQPWSCLISSFSYSCAFSSSFTLSSSCPLSHPPCPPILLPSPTVLPLSLPLLSVPPPPFFFLVASIFPSFQFLSRQNSLSGSSLMTLNLGECMHGYDLESTGRFTI